MKKRISALFLTLCLLSALLPPAGAANAITKGSAEYEELETLLFQFWWGHPGNYDCTDASAGDLLESIVKNASCCASFQYPYNTGTESWFENQDPLGRWASYRSISELQVDWVMKHIYNCPDPVITAQKEALLSKNDPSRYYLNGYYYYEIGGIGGPSTIEIESINQSGQDYQVTWSLHNGPDTPAEKFYFAVVRRKNIDGKDYWSLYSQRELAPGESPKDTFWFPDVKESDYFYKPVQWAYEQGIAQGSGGYFLPNSTCNIGEILTFIWRAAGSPEPTIQNPYANMKAGAYYYKAALWAYQAGIFEATLASPTTPCSRAETVTMLWKLKGSPEADTVIYSDVSARHRSSQAVSWAVRNGITAGSGDTTFSPDNTCTRGQVITFLYRCFVEPSPVKLPSGVPEPQTPQSYGTWSAAYQDFVAGENFVNYDFPYNYVNQEETWGDESPWGTGEKYVHLHDMDADGIPELIISNGHWGHLDRGAYIYTFADGKITYIGLGMPDVSYLPGSSFTGIFGGFYAGSGGGSYSYYRKNGGKIESELLYTYDSIENKEERRTANDALYNGFRNDSKQLYGLTAAEITETGWEAFVKTALG